MTVTIPYDPEWKAHDWAKKHCPSYISNKSNQMFGGIVYYFSDERDVTMFILRWS